MIGLSLVLLFVFRTNVRLRPIIMKYLLQLERKPGSFHFPSLANFNLKSLIKWSLDRVLWTGNFVYVQNKFS